MVGIDCEYQPVFAADLGRYLRGVGWECRMFKKINN